MRSRLDPVGLAAQRRRNLRDSGLILAGVTGLAALAGWLAAGETGVAILVLGAWAGVALQPQAAWVMRRLSGARPLPPALAPGLWSIHAELCRRADLDVVPPLFIIPGRSLQALSSGWGRDCAVAISEGLLRTLSAREIAAVLAHEIGHIRAGDLRILRLAELAGRLTHATSLACLIALALILPGALEQGFELSSWPLAALILSPIGCDLLTLKLSRTREFAADACSAELTQDPEALMAALSRLGSRWDRRARSSLIHTHPGIDERIERLSRLVAPARPGLWDRVVILPVGW